MAFCALRQFSSYKIVLNIKITNFKFNSKKKINPLVYYPFPSKGK